MEATQASVNCELTEPSPSTSRKRSKTFTSPVWNYFEKCNDDQFACCTICGAKYQQSKNTSNLTKETSQSQPTLAAVVEKRCEYPSKYN